MLPNNRGEFEALPFLEAKVLTSQPIGGEVQIVQSLTLGQWARAIQLPAETRLCDLPPGYQPSQEVFDPLLNQAKQEQWAIWTTTAKHWKSLEETSAICVFVTDADTDHPQDQRRTCSLFDCLILSKPLNAAVVDARSHQWSINFGGVVVWSRW
jgi:hypothetical protein